MSGVADVSRRFAADSLSAHGASMLPSHRRAIEDILDCRTAALGGQVWRCDTCSTEVFSFHSCGNRSCPKCHTAQTQEWLEHRQAEMLPVPYFHITVTVPAELREVLRANQRDGYAALMKATAEAIIALARDRRHVGGTVRVIAVLRYLARYVFRVAITEGRIVRLDDDGVAIRHKHRASGRWHTTHLNGHE